MSYLTIDQPTAELDEQGLPYQRADALLAAFGGRTAQALGQASDLLALGAQQYRQQLMQHQLLAHESAANDALNQYRLQGDELWRQYGGTRLREAVEGHDAYQQGLQANRAQAQQGLSAASQALLREALHQEHQDRVQLGEAHRAVQDQAWSDQSSLDTLGINKQAAVLHRDDPARVQALAQRGDGEWLKLGERRGWSDRRIGDQVRAWRGQVYGAVIDRQLHEGNIGGAGALLARVQGELDPPTADALGGRIVLANAKIQDQRNAPVVVGGGIEVAQNNPQSDVIDDAGSLPTVNGLPPGPGTEIAKGIAGKSPDSTIGEGKNSLGRQTNVPSDEFLRHAPQPASIDIDISKAFHDAVAGPETGDDYSQVGWKGYTDPKTKSFVPSLDKNNNQIWNALGKYQLQDNALEQIGAVNGNNRDDWNTEFGRKYNIKSFTDFVQNPEAQEAAFHAYVLRLWSQIESKNLLRFIGQRIDGMKASFNISLARLIAGAYRGGSEGLKSYLEFLAAHNWQSKNIDLLKDESKKTRYKQIEMRMREIGDIPLVENSDYDYIY